MWILCVTHNSGFTIFFIPSCVIMVFSQGRLSFLWTLGYVYRHSPKYKVYFPELELSVKRRFQEFIDVQITVKQSLQTNIAFIRISTAALIKFYDFLDAALIKTN